MEEMAMEEKDSDDDIDQLEQEALGSKYKMYLNSIDIRDEINMQNR